MPVDTTSGGGGIGLGDIAKWGQLGVKGYSTGSNLLKTFGSGVSPDTLSGLSSVAGAAGLILQGLKAAGVVEQEAVQVVSSLISLVSNGVALSQAIPALTQLGVISSSTASALTGAAVPAMTTMGALGAVAGGATAVAAPFIAFGLHELEASMRPNMTPIKRRLDEQMYNRSVGQVRGFNELASTAREQGISDPNVLNALLQAGESSVLDFYRQHQQVGAHMGIPGIAKDASPSGQVGGFDFATQGEMMQPYRQAMMEVAGLNQALGDKAQGSTDWYGIFGGQLNPLALPGDARGLNAGQYSERFTP